ncbi:MAG: putative lipid II flippase FtsW [Planctomycetaceae bacterium]|nr:putative lipid II flippase FtsW [Planctomycetaceae bacterium]
MTTTELEPADLARTMSWHRARLLMIVSSLTGFGIIMVYSASALRAARGGWEMSYASNQLLWLAVAITALVTLSLIPYRVWLHLRYPMILACYALLAMVLTPLGTRVNGSNRWFRFAGFNVQPSELAKIALIIAVAAFLARIPDGRPRFFRHVIPLCAMAGIAVVLVGIEPDFGTASLIGCAVGVLLLAGGVRIWQCLLLVTPAAPAAAWYGYSRFEYIARRVHDWHAGDAYHTNASELAIGSGGLWGVGLGQGPAKLDYLPEAHTDFIFAMVGQETGLIGALSLVALFAILVWQGMAIARSAQDRFGSLLAFGFTAVMGGQAIFNMGVVTGLLPPKGISLPFVSFGGSGLVVFYSMIGIMVSVTRGVQPSPEPVTDLTKKYKPIPAFKAETLESVQ